MARLRRMQGCNVLHPIGWDAFGLPAEQYALQTGTHPAVTTERNIARFRQQLQALGAPAFRTGLGLLLGGRMMLFVRNVSCDHRAQQCTPAGAQCNTLT